MMSSYLTLLHPIVLIIFFTTLKIFILIINRHILYLYSNSQILEAWGTFGTYSGFLDRSLPIGFQRVGELPVPIFTYVISDYFSRSTYQPDKLHYAYILQYMDVANILNILNILCRVDNNIAYFNVANVASPSTSLFYCNYCVL